MDGMPVEINRQDAESLRDYFAGQALTGVLAHRHYTGQMTFMSGGSTVEEDAAVIAYLSYAIADAMIAAREAS